MPSEDKAEGDRIVAQALREASARWKAGDDPAPRQPAPGKPMNVVIPKHSVNRPRKGIVRTPSGEPLPGSRVYERRERQKVSTIAPRTLGQR